MPLARLGHRLDRRWRDRAAVAAIAVTLLGPAPHAAANRDAADTINADDLAPGGSLGLNLTGDGVTVGIWDGGRVRHTHRELAGRVTVLDTAPFRDDAHTTHVAGTLAAAGIDPRARGIAPDARIRSRNWLNDHTEMRTDAPLLDITSHSYGNQNSLGGEYNASAFWIDEVLYDFPHLLSVWAAGNQGTRGFFSIQSGGGQTAKNSLVVGAVEDHLLDPHQPTRIEPIDFSNKGPTRDGRIRPDVVAGGRTVFSTSDAADDAYRVLSGTSMATPAVSGAAALLLQHHRNLHAGDSPRAASLKGLIVHTATDAHTPGPDPVTGYGLVNAAEAAAFLTEDAAGSPARRLIEDTFTGEDRSWSITATGDPLKATLTWTDPPAPLGQWSTPLVHDLDLRITDPHGHTHFPWTIDRLLADAPARRDRPDHVSNLEQVLIDATDPGQTYTIHVGGGDFTQDFSLLISNTSLLVIPEPATLALLSLCLVIARDDRRHRRRP